MIHKFTLMAEKENITTKEGKIHLIISEEKGISVRENQPKVEANKLTKTKPQLKRYDPNKNNRNKYNNEQKSTSIYFSKLSKSRYGF